MKAIVFTRYGPPEVLQLKEVETLAPKANEVRMKVRATTATIGDSRMRSFTVPRGQWLFARMYLGIRGPRRQVLGMELAGDTDKVGAQVTSFKVGDPVFGSTFAADFGGYAEYKCLPEDGIVALKPANVSYEEAAALPGAGMTALRCLRKASLQRGQEVLVYGASGAVGTYAVQIAAHAGAEVTGVCSTANLDLVKSLGARSVIDYTREDFAQSGALYDVVFDAVHKIEASHAKRALKKSGVYLDVHTASSSGGERIEDLLFLKELVEAGAIRPFIDRCYALEQIVEAHRYVDNGYKRGSVAILVADCDAH